MFSNQSAELSLNAPCRRLSSLDGDRTASRFLVGTAAVVSSATATSATTIAHDHTNRNRLHLLRFREELNELRIESSFDLLTSSNDDDGDGGGEARKTTALGEVWDVSSCPSDRGLILTCTGGGAGAAARTTLWRIPDAVLEREDDEDDERDDDNDGYGGSGGGYGGGGYSGNGDDGGYGRGYDDGDDDDDDFRGGGRSGGGGGPDNRRSTSTESSSSSARRLEEVAVFPPNKESAATFGGRLSCSAWRSPGVGFGLGGGGGGGGGFGGGGGASFDDDDLPRLAPSYSGESGASSSSSGAHLLTVDYDRTLSTWDLSDGYGAVALAGRYDVGGGLGRNGDANGVTVEMPPHASWDPHDRNVVAATCGTSVVLLDVRCPRRNANGSDGGGGSGPGSLRRCHRYGVSDVDYNPNKPHVLATSGLDGTVKVWDVRVHLSSSSPQHNDDDHNLPRGRRRTSSSSPSRPPPLKILRGGHAHWSTRISYNAFHDQLLISAGSDSVVNLWRIGSVSSAPLLELDDDDDVEGDGSVGGGSGSGEDMGMGVDLDDDLGSASSPPLGDFGGGGSVDEDGGDAGGTRKKKGGGGRQGRGGGGSSAPDVRVSRFEATDAVYDVAWSAADAWSYVSLSCDGNVVLHHVPSKEKYKILL